jgi:hypothetical protein
MRTSGYPRLAIALGILLPLGETIRRWGRWSDWVFWIDDFISRAKYYPEDADFLLEFEPTVQHHELYG